MRKQYDFSAGKRGAVIASPGKTRITIMLDDDVIEYFRAKAEAEGVGYQTGPLVVSCGTQQSKSLVVVEPGGHVGRLHLSLSTCPRGGCWEHGFER